MLSHWAGMGYWHCFQTPRGSPLLAMYLMPFRGQNRLAEEVSYADKPELRLLDPHDMCSVQFSSVQSLSHVQLFVTPWTVALQASLSITNSQSLLKLMSMSQ